VELVCYCGHSRLPNARWSIVAVCGPSILPLPRFAAPAMASPPRSLQHAKTVIARKKAFLQLCVVADDDRQWLIGSPEQRRAANAKHSHRGAVAGAGEPN
jgi:hypothetical protein